MNFFAQKRKEIFIALGFVGILALACAGYFASQMLLTPEVRAQQEIDRLAREVGKKVVLPRGESPTLATVTNKNRLDNQLFFKKAENGDKILLYPIAKRAVLYRPSTGKIVDMGDLDVARE